jgi:hypothetical protein
MLKRTTRCSGPHVAAGSQRVVIVRWRQTWCSSGPVAASGILRHVATRHVAAEHSMLQHSAPCCNRARRWGRTSARPRISSSAWSSRPARPRRAFQARPPAAAGCCAAASRRRVASRACHVARRTLRCHVACRRLCCHVACRTLRCHVARRTLRCHVACRALPRHGGSHGPARAGTDSATLRRTP